MEGAADGRGRVSLGTGRSVGDPTESSALDIHRVLQGQKEVDLLWEKDSSPGDAVTGLVDRVEGPVEVTVGFQNGIEDVGLCFSREVGQPSQEVGLNTFCPLAGFVAGFEGYRIHSTGVHFGAVHHSARPNTASAPGGGRLVGVQASFCLDHCNWLALTKYTFKPS